MPGRERPLGARVGHPEAVWGACLAALAVAIWIASCGPTNEPAAATPAAPAASGPSGATPAPAATMPGWQLVVAAGQAQARLHPAHACFALAEGESLDATIPAAGFTAGYSGTVTIEAPGKYRFGAAVEGGVAKVSVFDSTGPKLGEVINAGEANGLFTAWVTLKPGPVTVSVVFTRGAGSARLRTLWEREGQGEAGFAAEAIPVTNVAVPKFAGREAAAADAAFRGRVLLGELGCVNCHSAGEPGEAVLTKRQAPLLGRVGARARSAWLANWVGDPQAVKPGCGMPGLLADQGKAEAESIAQFLAGLGGLAEEQAAATERPVLDLGRRLYHTVGCVACHGALAAPVEVFPESSGLPSTMPDAKPAQPFGNLAGKWQASELSAFLREPLRAHPGGRMPSMALKESEPDALAAYLVTTWGSGTPQEPAAPDPAKAAAGKAAFAARGCAACHQMGEGAEEVASTLKARPLADLKAGAGCLSPADRATPRYRLSDGQRTDLAAGIEAVKHAIAAGTPAPCPLDQAERIVAAMGCRNCHSRDAVGGPADSIKSYFRTADETELGDEGRFPPHLTAEGFKLRTPWLKRVLTEAGRARPYMATRMPQFGELQVGALPGLFAAGAGVAPESDVAPPPPTDDQVLAGRKLVGEKGMNCISCHAFAAKTAGTAGLEITELTERIRYEWFRGYILAPARFKPETRMTAFFKDGNSTIADVFGGDPGQQSRALWGYLSKGKEAPAPEGLPGGKALPVAIGDRPVVFRTFLKDAGSRGIAVGYPIGIHCGFDATAVRMVDAWEGEFVDAAGAWHGRGGETATGQGKQVWSAPAGPALVVGAKPEPWPAATGSEGGYRFHGYKIERDGTPTFRYAIAGGPLEVAERFRPRPREGVLIAREFEMEGLQPGATVWINAGPGKTELVSRTPGAMDVQRVQGAEGATWFGITAKGTGAAFIVEITP